MTRDEAMHRAFKEAMKISLGQSSDNLSRLIDSIYDDFETQTCENCIHHGCGFMSAIEKDIGFMPDNFSCNKWEKMND